MAIGPLDSRAEFASFATARLQKGRGAGFDRRDVILLARLPTRRQPQAGELHNSGRPSAARVPRGPPPYDPRGVGRT